MSQAPAADGGWLRYDEPEQARAGAALLLLPHAGAGAASFNRWLGLFPSAIGPVRAQLPGREDRAAEPAVLHADEAVAALTEHVSRLIDLPVALYGHSMGALLAFELAHALTGLGTPPTHLFVSGRRAPQLPARHEPIHHLPDDAFAAALTDRGAGLGAAGDSRAFLRYAAPLIKADLHLSEEYVFRARAPLTCPITVFAGAGDPIVETEEVAAWRELTTGGFAVRVFSGDHFFHQSNREALAAAITKAMMAAMTTTEAAPDAPSPEPESESESEPEGTRRAVETLAS